MAIYHQEVKVVSQGTGRSSVAAPAYLSNSKIFNDYDGVQHDYTLKRSCVEADIFTQISPPECKTVAHYRAPWKKTRKQSTAALLVNLSLPCL